jgi:hypothetical protein
MTIKDYETIWTNLSNERRKEIVGESVINNMEILKQRLEDGPIDKVNEFGNASLGGDLIGIGKGKGSWKIVEIIDKEAIAASQYIQMKNSTLSLNENIILLHFKIQPSYCVFIIRSDIEGIIDNVAEEMKSYFIVE